jgi:NAD(P)-dependent dehydrogenase (short-subunit alcohol dehydrogenase family)
VRRGIYVILTSRDEARGQAAAQALGAEGLDVGCHQLDVTYRDSVQRLRDFVERELGRLDILSTMPGYTWITGIACSTWIMTCCG